MLIDKNGLNPTIPLCYYCGKEKNQIVLTGAEGSNWARKNGIPSGEMPKNVWIYGDYEPCDDCKKKGIAIVEFDSENNPTDRRWLVTEDYIKRIINNEKLLSNILEKRVAFIDETTAKKLGF